MSALFAFPKGTLARHPRVSRPRLCAGALDVEVTRCHSVKKVTKNKKIAGAFFTMSRRKWPPALLPGMRLNVATTMDFCPTSARPAGRSDP